MAKIWLKIWLKVKENGTKKNQIGENGGERKRNPSANPVFPGGMGEGESLPPWLESPDLPVHLHRIVLGLSHS